MRIGVSACLLGHSVRYDGGHKRNQQVCSVDGLVDWISVCPEAELGLGVPRPPMEIRGDRDRRRLVVIESGADLSASMSAYAADRLETLADLDGYLFKSKSPSCALTSAPVMPVGELGPGLFAQAFADRWPQVPICEESAFNRDFMVRVLEARRLRLRPANPAADRNADWDEQEKACLAAFS